MGVGNEQCCYHTSAKGNTYKVLESGDDSIVHVHEETNEWNILPSVIFSSPALGQTAKRSERLHPGRLSDLCQPNHEAGVWWPSSLFGVSAGEFSAPLFRCVELQGESVCAEPNSHPRAERWQRHCACALEISPQGEKTAAKSCKL